jgi:hypothetical protein
MKFPFEVLMDSVEIYADGQKLIAPHVKLEWHQADTVPFTV